MFSYVLERIDWTMRLRIGELREELESVDRHRLTRMGSVGHLLLMSWGPGLRGISSTRLFGIHDARRENPEGTWTNEVPAKALQSRQL